MNYKLSNAAANDLTKIWLYTMENWSVKQADKYISLIFNELDYLCHYPDSATDYSHVRNGYFRSRVNSHYIFFRIDRKQLEVIRILHEMMDIESHI